MEMSLGIQPTPLIYEFIHLTTLGSNKLEKKEERKKGIQFLPPNNSSSVWRLYSLKLRTHYKILERKVKNNEGR